MNSDPLNWTVLLPIIVGAFAIWYLLPSPQRRPLLFGGLAGLIAIAGVGAFLIRGLGEQIPATLEAVLFYGFSVAAIIFAALMITNKNPARSALCFAMVVLNTCGLFLLLAAPFLSAATIIIYAGAIIVTFLFVIMLSNQHGPSNADLRSREPALGAIAGFLLMATLLVGLQRVYNHKSIDRLIEESKQLAAAEKIDTAYFASTPPGELENSKSDGLSAKGRQFINDCQNALDALKISETRSSDDSRLTDHKVVLDTSAAIQGLKLIGFKERDHDEVRRTCKIIGDGLSQLRDIRDSVEKPVELKLSPYGEVKAIDSVGGPKRMPSANVSALGRTLFTDHLIAVELAGTLLLIATIGAIVIAGGRKEKLK